jgi:hypothetical protein
LLPPLLQPASPLLLLVMLLLSQVLPLRLLLPRSPRLLLLLLLLLLSLGNLNAIPSAATKAAAWW